MCEDEFEMTLIEALDVEALGVGGGVDLLVIEIRTHQRCRRQGRQQ
jgi:hypothetical protein